MNLEDKRIFIFQQRKWGKTIGHFLALKLQEEGARIAAITLKRSTHEFTLNQTDVHYDVIIGNDEIMSRPKEYLAGDTYSLQEICDSLGVDSVWPLIMTLRNHVRSYKDKYYYSFRQNVSDEDIINYVKAVYKYINIIFEKFKPDLILSPNFVSLPHIMFNLFFAKKGIKMLGVTDSKVVGHHIFTESFQDDRGSFYTNVDALNANKKETTNREKAKKYINDFRNLFKPHYTLKENRLSFLQNLKNELIPYKQVLRWYIKGSSKDVLESTGITIDYRPPRIILRDHYCNKKYKKIMKNFNYHPFEKIDKYVYFPLQFQPEASIDVLSPYFSNQIETARQVAMSLPGDYTLVVKEHPGMVGLRPPSYIEKIARTPNVKLIDYRISGEEVLKKAALVVSPSGTTIAEAAFLKKSVIQLGNLGTTLKLPNVFKHTDMTTLSSKIKEILNIDLNTNEYERKLENYVAAVYDTGFNVNYTKAWKKGSKEELESLWIIYKKELERNFI